MAATKEQLLEWEAIFIPLLFDDADNGRYELPSIFEWFRSSRISVSDRQALFYHLYGPDSDPDMLNCAQIYEVRMMMGFCRISDFNLKLTADLTTANDPDALH